MHVAAGLDLTFLDSLNFLQMKLSKIPACFDLTEMKKGYFPHLFNKKENKHYVGSYPSLEYYGVDYMSAKERTEFEKWHLSKNNEVFDFQRELREYCISDVDILRKGCMKFREIMMSVTSTTKKNDKGKTVKLPGLDPFNYVTIASACQAIYRELFLEEEYETYLTNRITRRPLKDQRNMRKVTLQTHSAKHPFVGWNGKWRSVDEKGAPLYIKHALNEGEHRLPGTRYRLDGYVEKTKTAYEFHGCVVHGCPQCYPQDRSSTKHPLTKHTMNELYYATKRKEMFLKRMGYKYVCIWEHEYHRKINLEEGMKEYVTSLDVVDRLNVRDSFLEDDLYPSVNKYAKYVCGHPDIITSNFKDLSLYFGFAKVRVLPPRNLFHPVLPYTTRDGKLKFPLCKKCADIEFQDKCVCLDKDRAIVGTWCTPELELAVSKGYQILKLYEVYHFNDTSEYDRKTGTGGLFAGYVNMFLKLKQEASGFPQECQTEEEKLDYIIKYAEKENIRLDYEQINKNPGLRTLAKICLNSFWGKFGQRLNMSQLTFLYNTEVDKFFQLLSDSTKKSLIFISSVMT
ncbi:unnamed protein product [Mytilus edulis]|uniref:DNA-directed DNA polymerase n=1 Tax=Mytilus edulis TaxID=6550 RepID=A0A8S3TY64_MYTED|nr:unnamed protein product [Mytilus edulis]